MLVCCRAFLKIDFLTGILGLINEMNIVDKIG